MCRRGKDSGVTHPRYAPASAGFCSNNSLQTVQGGAGPAVPRCGAGIPLSAREDRGNRTGKHSLLLVPAFQPLTGLMERGCAGEVAWSASWLPWGAELPQGSLLCLTGGQRGPPGLPGRVRLALSGHCELGPGLCRTQPPRGVHQRGSAPALDLSHHGGKLEQGEAVLSLTYSQGPSIDRPGC